MPIDTRFLKLAKDKAGALKRSGVRIAKANPLTATSAAAAMLLAPVLLKTDDRDYLRTAAMTTPLIGAGALAVTQMAPKASAVAENIVGYHNARKAYNQTIHSTEITYNDIKNAQQAYEDQKVGLAMFQSLKRRFYAGRRKGPGDFSRESSSLAKTVNDIVGEGAIVTDSRIRYMSNAIHAEKARTLSAARKVDYAKSLMPAGSKLSGKGARIPNVAPILTPAQIRDTVEQETRLGNAAFIKGLNYRLSRMQKLVDPGGSRISPIAGDPFQTRFSTTPWENSLLRDRIANERPDLYEAMKSAWSAVDINGQSVIDKGGISKGRKRGILIKSVTDADGNDQITGMIVHTKGRKKGTWVPYVSDNGLIDTGGAGFSRNGVAGKFYTADREMNSDTYFFEALTRGFKAPAIATELTRTNVYGLVDQSLDDATYMDAAFKDQVLSAGSRRFGQYKRVPSNLFGFQGGEDMVDMGFNQLPVTDKERAIIEASKSHGIRPLGSEGGAAEGVMFKNHLAELSLNASSEKQNSVYRAVTKPVWLGAPEGTTSNPYMSVRENFAPFFQTNKLQLEDVTDHVMGTRVAGLSPGEISLFGNLDMKTARAAEDTIDHILGTWKDATSVQKKQVRVQAYADAFRESGFDVHAMSILRAEHQLSSDKSKEVWAGIVEQISNPETFRAMTMAGRAGDGDFLTRPGMHGARVERYTPYDVHQEAFPDWDKPENIGRSLEDIFGRDKKTILGYRSGNEIVAKGETNIIDNVATVTDDLLRITVRESKPVGTGTKGNIGPNKGIMQEFMRDDSYFDTFREVINRTRAAAGDLNQIPAEVDIFASATHFTDKMGTKEGTDNLASLVGDSLRRIQEGGELDEFMSRWQQPMDRLGFVYRQDVGTLEKDVETTRGMDPVKVLEDTQQLLLQMMADAGDRVGSKIKGDSLMQSYQSYKAAGGDMPWADYVARNAMPVPLRVTDDMVYNIPKQTKIAYYTKQKLALRGFHGAAAELADRTEYEGDVAETEAFQRYLNGDSDAITNRLSLSEATDNRKLTGIKSAEQRMNTIFDPGFAKAEGNFLLEMPGRPAIPVMGHSAYGGKVNVYGAGEFSINDTEAALFDVVKSHLNNESEAVFAGKAAAYEMATKKYLHGKKSFYRGGAIDPLAESPRIVTRTSGMRYSNGEVNPFEIAIGRDAASRIKDKKAREALFGGQDLFTAVTREPVSHVPFAKIVIDDSLNGSNLVGMDPAVQALLKGDSDGDYSMRYLMSPGSNGHNEAAAEVFGEASIQRGDLQFYREKMGGSQELLRDIVGSKPKSFVAGVMKDKILDEASVLSKRTTSGGIGAGSNLYTLLTTGLEENMRVTDPALKGRMDMFFFDLVKQSPISAAKHSSEVEMNQTRLLGIYSKIGNSMKGKGNFDHFYSGMAELAEAADGGTQGRFKDTLFELRQHMQDFHSGFDRDAVAQAVSAVTTMPEKAANVKQLGMDRSFFAYAQGASESAERAASSAQKAAEGSSETLGAINKIIEEGRSVAGETRGKVGAILGLGLAAAAIAGVATTNLRRPTPVFGRHSSSNYRPEETAGTKDQIPGEGQAGSRNPSGGSRNIRPAVSGTSTAIVAPLGESRDMDVQLRAKDKQQAHRTAKLMAKMATDGDSTVTVNYRDQMKPKSLRTRERMREALEG